MTIPAVTDGMINGATSQLTSHSETSLPAISPVESARIAILEDRLRLVLQAYGRVVVAFSGGVDSAVVTSAAVRFLGQNAIAVTGDSPSLAIGELAEAEALAKKIGIRHIILRTEEFADPAYAANPSNRCYFCKTELYKRILSSAAEIDFPFDAILNGANLDDRGDHRPGMVAAAEHRVKSPLLEAELTKADVRLLARHWGLSVWDKPAAPCLSSRLAYGVAATPERVRRVDAAESYLRHLLQTRELRVRIEPNELARIEVPLHILSSLTDASVRESVVDKLNQLGFRYITLDLVGFRSGSTNDTLSPSQLIPLQLSAPET